MIYRFTYVNSTGIVQEIGDLKGQLSKANSPSNSPGKLSETESDSGLSSRNMKDTLDRLFKSEDQRISLSDELEEQTRLVRELQAQLSVLRAGESPLIYIYFIYLLLNYICKLHWNHEQARLSLRPRPRSLSPPELLGNRYLMMFF